VVRESFLRCPAISLAGMRTYEVSEASLESLEVEKEGLVRLNDLLKVFQFDRYQPGPIISQETS